jgi:hypothetical protein
MEQIYLRINGIEVTNVGLRRKMLLGLPVGGREVVIEDTRLGKFAIDDNFVIETSSNHKDWVLITIADLLLVLDNLSREKS